MVYDQSVTERQLILFRIFRKIIIIYIARAEDRNNFEATMPLLGIYAESSNKADVY